MIENENEASRNLEKALQALKQAIKILHYFGVNQI